jgi:hypothetical protein
MEVFEDDQHSGPASERPEESHDRLRHDSDCARLADRRTAPLWHDMRERTTVRLDLTDECRRPVAMDRSEGFGERSEWDVGRRRDGTPTEHAHSGRYSLISSFSGEPALPDSRFARHDHDGPSTATSCRERRIKKNGLLVPPDERF